jgi:uncharacterized delta-60 repeat protein
MRGRNFKKAVRSLLCLSGIVAASLGCASPASANPGQLDRTFGDNGKVVAFRGAGPAYWGSIHLVRTPGGRILVAVSHKVLRYLPDGKRDPSFADDGVLDVEVAKPPSYQGLSGLAVDPAGRIVTATNNAQAEVEIRRYLPDGTPDPTFGAGTGVVETTFGLPPPTPLGASERPFVFATAVAIDQSGRILVSGITDRRFAYETEGGGFVARLAPTGALDESFGNGGTVVIEEPISDRAESLILDPAGGPIFLGKDPEYRGEPGLGSAVIRLTSGGAPAVFGEGGYARIPGDSSGSLALDSSGRILATAGRFVTRLLPSGGPDRSFGRAGRTADLQGGKWSQLLGLALAGDGTILVVGSRVHKVKGLGILRRQLVVYRLSARGQLDTGFGRRGSAAGQPQRATSGSSAANLVGKDLVLDGRGHVIAAGAEGEALVLYRFDLR